MLNFFTGVFGSVVAILFLQLFCIVVSFFVPEFLYRLRREQQGWHVLAASGLLIVCVMSLTMMHSAAVKSKAKTGAPVQSAGADFTTTLTNVPFTTNKSAEFSLKIYNEGPKASFACFLSLLDAGSGAPSPKNAYSLEAQKETVTVRENETGACSWALKINKPGDYLLDAYVLKEGGAPSGHQQLALSTGKTGPEAAPPKPSAAAPAPASTPSATPDPAAAVSPGHADLIWIYSAKTDGADKLAADRLAKAGYKNVAPQGRWETETGEQYIFYRDKDKAAVDQIAKDASIPRLQDYHYNGDRVGKRIKNLFTQNNGLKYVMIVH
jgi:hypothetical protein